MSCDTIASPLVHQVVVQNIFFPKFVVMGCDDVVSLASFDFPYLYKWLQMKDSLIYVCTGPCSSFMFKVCIAKKKVVLGFF